MTGLESAIQAELPLLLLGGGTKVQESALDAHRSDAGLSQAHRGGGGHEGVAVDQIAGVIETHLGGQRVAAVGLVRVQQFYDHLQVRQQGLAVAGQDTGGRALPADQVATIGLGHGFAAVAQVLDGEVGQQVRSVGWCAEESAQAAPDPLAIAVGQIEVGAGGGGGHAQAGQGGVAQGNLGIDPGFVAVHHQHEHHRTDLAIDFHPGQQHGARYARIIGDGRGGGREVDAIRGWRDGIAAGKGLVVAAGYNWRAAAGGHQPRCSRQDRAEGCPENPGVEHPLPGHARVPSMSRIA